MSVRAGLRGADAALSGASCPPEPPMSPARPRWLSSLLLLPLALALLAPAPADAATRKAQKKPVASQARALA